MPGESQKGPSGTTVMGDKTINKAIRSAREDKKIDAIIFELIVEVVQLLLQIKCGEK